MLGRRKPEEGERSYSPAETLGYAAREVAKGSNAADMAIAGINASGAVLRELISAAKANQIVGVILSAIIVDMLASTKVISSKCEAFCFMALATAFGVTVALEVTDAGVSAISAIDPFKSGGPTPPDPADLIKPVPTTIVENPPAAANASVPSASSSAATAGQVAGLIRSVPPV